MALTVFPLVIHVFMGMHPSISNIISDVIDCCTNYLEIHGTNWLCSNYRIGHSNIVSYSILY